MRSRLPTLDFDGVEAGLKPGTYTAGYAWRPALAFFLKKYY